MRIIICLTVLLCMRLSVSPAHAQGNSDLKGTACVPVRTLAEDKLAFQAGEKLDFVLHYRWGAINSDVGYATVRLDDVRFNGKDAFSARFTDRPRSSLTSSSRSARTSRAGSPVTAWCR